MDEEQLVSPQQKQVQLCPPGQDRLLWDPSESGQRKSGHYRLQTVAVRKKKLFHVKATLPFLSHSSHIVYSKGHYPNLANICPMHAKKKSA